MRWCEETHLPTRNCFLHGSLSAFHLYQALRSGDILGADMVYQYLLGPSEGIQYVDYWFLLEEYVYTPS